MTSAVERLRASDRSPLVLVLAGLLVVALVGLALLGWRTTSESRVAEAEREALSVARERAVQLTSYRHDTFEDDVSWAEEGATETFREEYAQANEPLRTVVERLEATAQGAVEDAAATAEDASTVRVLLFVDQTITQAVDGEQRTERNRVVMTMVRQDEAWLVDDVSLR